MTADRFREIVLSFDGVEERAHMGHPDFRAGGRIFASLHSKDQFGMVKLTPAEQRACIKENPETFSPSSGAWGRQGCTNIHLASASVPTVRAAVTLAWQAIVSKPGTKTRRPRRARR